MVAFSPDISTFDASSRMSIVDDLIEVRYIFVPFVFQLRPSDEWLMCHSYELRKWPGTWLTQRDGSLTFPFTSKSGDALFRATWRVRFEADPGNNFYWEMALGHPFVLNRMHQVQMLGAAAGECFA